MPVLIDDSEIEYDFCLEYYQPGSGPRSGEIVAAPATDDSGKTRYWPGCGIVVSVEESWGIEPYKKLVYIKTYPPVL